MGDGAGRGDLQAPAIHPAAGMTPGAFVSLLLRARRFPWRALKPLAIGGQTWLLRRRHIRRARAAAAAAGPQKGEGVIFVVGFWRSATTLLHELLLLDPGARGPVLADAVFPADMPYLRKAKARVLERSLPSTRWFDAMPLTPGRPQEDELALAQLGVASLYDAILFPSQRRDQLDRALFIEMLPQAERVRWIDAHRHLLALLSVTYPGKRLVIKNPAHSTRLALLASLYPRAKFVRIDRDVAQVLPSFARMITTLTAMLSLEPGPIAIEAAECAALHARVMRVLNEGWAALPPDRRSRTRYEDLLADPVATVGRIHAELGLPATSRHALAIAEYWAREGAARVPAAGGDPRLP
jgi:hypothetical protein